VVENGMGKLNQPTSKAKYISSSNSFPPGEPFIAHLSAIHD